MSKRATTPELKAALKAGRVWLEGRCYLTKDSKGLLIIGEIGEESQIVARLAEIGR